MDVQSVVDGMMKLGLTKEQALGVIALLAQPAATTPAPGPEGPTVLTYYTEPFKDWGTPGTWHSDVTGHVIDFPHGQIDGKAWEGIAAYALRVSRQCHCEHPEGTISSIAASIKYPDGTPLTSDQRTWPKAVDFWFNHDAYLTPEQLDAEKGKRLQWSNLPRDFDTPEKQKAWQDAHPGEMHP